MGIMSDQLRQVWCPKPGEIWKVVDKKIVLHEKNREDKGYRPVLVVMSSGLLGDSNTLYHSVPLSASKGFDSQIIPVMSNFKACVEDFNKKHGSVALLRFYQPIEEQFFIKKCGVVALETYNAVRCWLKDELIGDEIFDYDI